MNEALVEFAILSAVFAAKKIFGVDPGEDALRAFTDELKSVLSGESRDPEAPVRYAPELQPQLDEKRWMLEAEARQGSGPRAPLAGRALGQGDEEEEGDEASEESDPEGLEDQGSEGADPQHDEEQEDPPEDDPQGLPEGEELTGFGEPPRERPTRRDPPPATLPAGAPPSEGTPMLTGSTSNAPPDDKPEGQS